MAKLTHQTVAVYTDAKGNPTGVCACGKPFPLAASSPDETTLAMHISLQNRNESMDV